MGRQIPLQSADDGAMYRSERKIYPRDISGRFQRLRQAAVFWLLGMYYLFPWLPWDGRQSVLFDLPARKFYVFGLVFWPQDFFLLALLLISAGLALFFFTTLAGRMWCGYACPQTVWTEVFLWVESAFEGDRHQRMKLDAGPWNGNKLLRKGGKHLAWLLLALWTGFTFVGFFTPIRDLGLRLFELGWGGWETFWVLFYSLATWGNAGVLREQVCKYMCPYARFQSAMFDRNTLIISYDRERGEARGARRRGVPSVLEAVAGGQPRAELGDCIDCTICVQVCPTGIDIRDGLQYECIACGACIDACDGVMERIGYPRGLVRYTSQNAVDGRRTRVLRTRVLVYAALLAALLGSAGWIVLTRTPVILDVMRDRNALYRTAANGAIENAYTLRIVNRDQDAHRFRIELVQAGPVGIAAAPAEIAAQPGQVVSAALTLRAAAGSVQGRNDLELRVVAVDDPQVAATETTRFFGPFAGGP
jgi:cytochrome c oxidase accessory protein FixG